VPSPSSMGLDVMGGEKLCVELESMFCCEGRNCVTVGGEIVVFTEGESGVLKIGRGFVLCVSV